jgi:hypothetical protein
MALSVQEWALARQIGFDGDVLEIVKHVTHAPLQSLDMPTWTWDELHERDIFHSLPGLLVIVPATQAVTLVRSLHPLLLAKGYMAFIMADSAYDDPRLRTFDDEGRIIPEDRREVGIGIIQGTDTFGFIARYTNIGPCSPSGRDIVKKLQTWQYLCTFDVVGVGHRWLELTFTTLPDDLFGFAADIDYLCPDIHRYTAVQLPAEIPTEDEDKEQRRQHVIALVHELQCTNALTLSWKQ